jgi:hypothetical protein
VTFRSLLRSLPWPQTRRIVTFFSRPTATCSLYTKGRSVIAVIEESPGTRTFRLDNNLLHQDRMNGNSGEASPHGLAIPYSVFILSFDNDLRNDKVSFRNMYLEVDDAVHIRVIVEDDALALSANARPCPVCDYGIWTVSNNLYWNKRPLATLDDQLYTPLLPNLHQNMTVCVGHEMTTNHNTPLSQQCGDIIGHFWNSNFNTDLSDKWWSRSTVDARLMNINRWKELSLDNPLFACGLNLKPAQRLKEVIDTAANAHTEVSLDMEAVKKRLVAIVDKASSDIEHGLMKYMKKTKFERFFPNDVKENLASAISTITDEIVVVLNRMAYDLHQIEEDNTRKQKDVKHYGWESRGAFWS